MNRYFKLTLASDAAIIGVKNGVHQGEIKWSAFENREGQKALQEYFSLERYQRNESDLEQLPQDIAPVAAYADAQLTDFFGFIPVLWGINFLVSEAVKKLLDDFHLPQHAYIPTKVYHRGTQYSYQALYLPLSYRADSIDFKHSLFFTGSDIMGKKMLRFSDLEDWNKNKVFRTEQLAFNEHFDRTLDLFVSSFGGSGYYISERLKTAMEQAGLTGMAITVPKEPALFFK